MSQRQKSQPTPNEKKPMDTGKPHPYAWVILAVAFLASLTAALNQSKVPPVMPVLMEAFNLSLTKAGLLMSVFAITGFFLALPAGLILQRLGLKVSGLIATDCLVIGSTLGALATASGLMLFSRVVEGIGMGLMAVVAPAAIAMWFPAQKQGIPMGIWATWVPLGATIMFILAPPMAAANGWQSIWWAGTAYSLLAFILVLIFMRMPPGAEGTRQTPGGEFIKLKQALANRNIWQLAAVFGTLSLAMMSINTYYPTFLATRRAYSMSSAAYIVSLSTMVMLVSAPLAGILLDKMGSWKALLTWPLLALSGLLVFPFLVTGAFIPILMILMGVVGAAVPTAAFTAAPEIMGKPELTGLGLGVVSLGQNLGMFSGPILFGILAENISWIAAGTALIPLLIAGFFLGRGMQVR